MKALRGAVNLDCDTEGEVSLRTRQLFDEIFEKNDIALGDIVCIIFSLTEDITSAYPAAVFRREFSSDVPLFECAEPKIKNSAPLMIRVLMLHDGKTNCHVYLRDAKNLRKDLKL